MAAPKKTVARAPTIQNRRARFDYEILETFECGIVLVGSEVKSIREGNVQLTDCYARVIHNELWLIGLHIQPYANAVGFGAHKVDRDRKLLAHRRQLDTMTVAVTEKQLVLVPLTMRFNEDRRVKLDIAIARPKKTHDKRHAIAARDSQRDEERETRRRR